MKRTGKLFPALLLTAALAALCAVGAAAAAKEPAVIAQGYCGAEDDGTNVAWTLTDDWTVTFSGTGEMADPPGENSPWDDAIIRHIFNEMGYMTDEDIALAMERLETVFDPDLYIGYLTAYFEARSNLSMIIENGITSVSASCLSLSRQTVLTLPESLTSIASSGYAHELTDVIVYNTGAVTGIEVPAYKTGALYPQTAEEAQAMGEVGGPVYFLGICVSRGMDGLVSDFASFYDMMPEEIEANYEELAQLAVAYYAVNTGVTATTERELYDAWLERINRCLGTDFTENDIFIQTQDEYGNDVFRYTEAYINAVTARFGYPPDTVFNLGSENYMLYSASVDDIGTEFVAAPWFTIHAPAGSATEAMALEKGIPFAPIPVCPEDYNHSVIRANGSEATCTAAGHTAGWYCEDCGTWLDGEEIPPLAHKNAYEVAETQPTATAHGHKAGVYCPDCDTWLSGHDVIHNQLGAREVIKEATATEEGEVYIVCTVCGETGLYAIEKLDPSENPTKPDDTDEPAGGMNIVEHIKNFAKSIVDWLLRLIRWIGKR